MLFYGGLLGAVVVSFSASSEEVVVWEGRQVVETNESWLDPLYVYYEYHGPFVRGRESLGQRSSA